MKKKSGGLAQSNWVGGAVLLTRVMFKWNKVPDPDNGVAFSE